MEAVLFSRLDQQIIELVADPDRALQLAAALAGPSGEHLDDEDFAALVEGTAQLGAVAHAVRCSTCADRATVLAELLSVVPFRTPGLSEARQLFDPDRALLFASVITHADGSIEIVECSGTTRIQCALAVRADAGVRTVSVRDRRRQPRLEVSLLAGARRHSVSLLVRWLARTSERLFARALVDGRVVAETDLSGDGTLLGDLRRRDLRVDVCGEDRILGSAWLRMEGP